MDGSKRVCHIIRIAMLWNVPITQVNDALDTPLFYDIVNSLYGGKVLAPGGRRGREQWAFVSQSKRNAEGRLSHSARGNVPVHC